MENQSAYDLLGVPRDASQEEIRRAYRHLVLHLHPDTNVNKGETSLFIDIQQAYEYLSDPVKKAEYDKQHPYSEEIPLFRINTFYSQPSIARLSEPQLIYCLLELSLQSEVKLPPITAPLNIALVVDCSTSMQGIRLDTVKLTAIELIRQLKSSDIFSLVKFNDRAELLIPAGNPTELKSSEMKIQLLQAGGGTEIYKGLELAFSQINQFRSDERINHIILITDGRTYGDEESCINLANEASESGVGISVLGIGSKWNDVFLEQITSITGGICRYVSEISEIRNTILDEISRLGSSLTEKIILNYTSSPEIQVKTAFRLHPDSLPLTVGSPMIIGNMPKQGIISILMEFIVDVIPGGTLNLNLVRGFINYRIPRHSSKSQYVQRLEFSRKVTEYAVNEPPPNAIMNAITLLSLYRMQERAREEMGRGDIKSATRHLELLATHLLKKGENDLAQSVLNEVSYIQNHQSFSEEGEKQLKYSTRALLLPAKT